MPTRENLIHLESLIEATTLLVETKKNVDRVENDIRVAKGKVMKRDEQLSGGDGGEVPMDVDQEVVADEDDAGVQSGRGARKKNVCFSYVLSCRTWGFEHRLICWHHRRDDPCQYLLSTPQLNPDGQIKGRNRVKFLSHFRSYSYMLPSCVEVRVVGVGY